MIKLVSQKCMSLMLIHLPLDKMADTFTDDIFKHILLNEKMLESLKYVPRGSNDNKSA